MFGRLARIPSTYKRLVLLLVIVGLAALHLSWTPAAVPQKIARLGVVDVLQERTQFSNPVYQQWKSTGYDSTGKLAFDSKALESKCSDYFGRLGKLVGKAPLVDMRAMSGFKLDAMVYKKKRWLREARITLTSELSKMQAKFTEEDMDELENAYLLKAQDLSTHEQDMFDQIGHARVFGKCFVENPKQMSSTATKHCKSYYERLYPWMGSSYPLIEDWLGQALDADEFPSYNDSSAEPLRLSGCFIHDFAAKSSGSGIVIPILPIKDRKGQIERIRNQIRVLRAIGNTLPIQITYMTDDELSSHEREQLVKTARGEKKDDSDAYNAYVKTTRKDSANPWRSDTHFPAQDVRFVNVGMVLSAKDSRFMHSKLIHNPTFMLALSSAFNTFGKAIIMTSRAIPVDEDFAVKFFESPEFRQHGHFFFKNPARFKQKRKRILPGFDEVNMLVKDYLTPSQQDATFFHFNRHDDNSFTNKAFTSRVQGILDSSLFVVDKKRRFNSFLMAANLQFYRLLNHRYEMDYDDVVSDYIWMGLELAGTSLKPAFNSYLGAAVGVMTPLENEPHDVVTSAHELCSASWGQVDTNDEYSLLYVTSHQLENWIEEPSFRVDLEKKFAVDKSPSNKGKTGSKDRSLFTSTFAKNPLYINSALIPPDHKGQGSFFAKPGEQEPNVGWIVARGFSDRLPHKYWCGYEVVSGVAASEKGRIIEYGVDYQAKIKFLLNVWMK